MSPAAGTALSTAPRAAELLSERAEYASRELRDCVELHPGKLGGVPVLKGTRMSVSQVLAELGDGRSVTEVAEDFDLDATLVTRLVSGLAVCFDHAVST